MSILGGGGGLGQSQLMTVAKGSIRRSVENVSEWPDFGQNIAMMKAAARAKRASSECKAFLARRAPTGQSSVSTVPSSRRYSRTHGTPSIPWISVSASDRLIADRLKTFL